MRRSLVQTITAGSLVALALIAGCTTEKIVYRSGSNFAAPPSSAKSFVGYSDETSKQTVCGGCHVDAQSKWVTTKHASAWSTLANSGSMQGYCQACHTVGAYGNAATDTTVGWNGSKDSRYHDVQCESCHGAGLTHASSPTSTNRPLASIKADTNISSGCGECHSGVHTPFVQEWRASLHSTSATATASITTAANTYCQGCHTAQGALLAFGVTENYIEKADTGKLMQSITCATCHAPHGSANDHQLRFPINTPSTETNLCMKCHQRRANVDITTTSGVHSPEGPTLLGTAGWFPPGMSASDSIIGSHGNTDRNPKLCATCHVSRNTINDAVTGKFVFQSTGHRFKATPCVDANGQPTVNQTCAVTAQTFRSCVATGCHASESAARSAFNSASARITLETNQLVALVAQAKAKKPADFLASAPMNTGRGANFNVSLAQKTGSFVHNPYLVEQLLVASINQIKIDYNLP